MAERTAAISARVPPALKAGAQKAAEAEGRTLAKWLERTVTEKLAALAAEKPLPGRKGK
jgi:predicted HicB family RNase H-like nuclease